MSNDAPTRRNFNRAVGAAAAGTAMQQLLGPGTSIADAAQQKPVTPRGDIARYCGRADRKARKKQVSPGGLTGISPDPKHHPA